ncbi:phosphoglycerate mutase [Thermogymnomonas acidicola]|uniref:2,3-bisphosphoglycerate-independent phosphoglycerate mutase n=1 Tax=Thermogymnomonas acidicola TaxID=399579 RepID=A0AA37BR91_9ARCH|nr:2,3-bisphosphoglycerate-independent phosphoglycerate mutase [Thermogymnomonas acidicola]GGM73691.1 phosphoglycerate mutase [Thermogymnomonas acidicola]
MSTGRSVILIVFDGLGDRPNPALGNRTALQAAYRPNLNRMARLGITGLLDTVSPGVVAGSDTSHLSLLGYDPRRYYTGRGPFEAMGLGIEVRPGDIAFRANFATREGGTITDRRAGRISSGTEELSEVLNREIDGVEFIFRPGVEHRGALVMRGEGLSDALSDSDPHDVGKPPREVVALDKGAERTASVLNRYLKEAREALERHPVNVRRRSEGKGPANELLVRGAGRVPDLPPFRQVHGFSGACIAGIPMITGICALLGMEVIKVEGATGSLYTNVDGKIAAAVEASRRHRFVIVNIKGTDVAGHDRNPVEKKGVIERADRAMGRILEVADRAVIAVTGDHSTPCSTGEHSGDPVPLLVFSPDGRRDSVMSFDEVSVARGALRLRGTELIEYLKQAAGLSEKYGA